MTTTITDRTELVELIERRVARGVQHLNNYYGDDAWKGQLDTSQLELKDTCQCVLGQLGGYNVMLDSLSLSEDDTDAVRYGFDFDYVDDDGQDLVPDEDMTLWATDSGPYTTRSRRFSEMYWEELNRAWLAHL